METWLALVILAEIVVYGILLRALWRTWKKEDAAKREAECEASWNPVEIVEDFYEDRG